MHVCERERVPKVHVGETESPACRLDMEVGTERRLAASVCVERERETDRDRGREEKRTEGERERGAPNLRVRVENVKGRHSGWLQVCERESV